MTSIGCWSRSSRPPNPVGGRGPQTCAACWMACSISCALAANGGTCRPLQLSHLGPQCTATFGPSSQRASGRACATILSSCCGRAKDGRPVPPRPSSTPRASRRRKRGPRGWDAAKRLKGRKRHVAVDTQGLLLGVVVHAANIQDADSLWDLLKRVKPLYSWLRVVFADSIYNRLTALLACFLFGLTLIIVRRAAGTTGFVVQPRRWVVERSLGWLGRWRRLSKDYEELPEVSEAMVTLAMIRLMLHRLVHPNRKRLPAS